MPEGYRICLPLSPSPLSIPVDEVCADFNGPEIVLLGDVHRASLKAGLAGLIGYDAEEDMFYYKVSAPACRARFLWMFKNFVDPADGIGVNDKFLRELSYPARLSTAQFVHSMLNMLGGQVMSEDASDADNLNVLMFNVGQLIQDSPLQVNTAISQFVPADGSAPHIDHFTLTFADNSSLDVTPQGSKVCEEGSLLVPDRRISWGDTWPPPLRRVILRGNVTVGHA